MDFYFAPLELFIVACICISFLTLVDVIRNVIADNKVGE
jgi:hypothetical protein